MLVVLAVITNMCRTGKSLPCDALLALVESRRTGRLAGRSQPTLEGGCEGRVRRAVARDSGCGRQVPV